MMDISNEMQIEYLPVSDVKDYKRKLRISNPKQIEKMINLIRECGIVQPIVIDKDNCVVLGWLIVEAARQMRVDTIPTVKAEHLSEGHIQLLRIAYERIAEGAEWDKEALKLEFKELELSMPRIDLVLTGFETPEIDIILGDNSLKDVPIPIIEDEDVVTQEGDLWLCDQHKIICGNSLEEETYQTLMEEDELADMCMTDPPFNVPVDGHVCGQGKIKHAEFAMASGEMSEEEFIAFLATYIKWVIKYSRDGSLHYHFMDWRHIYELIQAGRDQYDELKNICIWNKNNGGMGALYRSKHEMVAVFKKGKISHTNNIQMGKHGRYRTNVWDYAGVNSFTNKDDLKMHPTVKPVALIADAIKDCTKRGNVVIDPFMGSGSTLIACEQTTRVARCIELEPKYCDVAITRWQNATGRDAVHARTGETYNQLKQNGGVNNE